MWIVPINGVIAITTTDILVAQLGGQLLRADPGNILGRDTRY
jgi:hypothetical protein